MRRYLAGRVAWLVLALAGVSMLTFALGTLAPGDPAEILLERRLGAPPPAEQIAEQRELMGLDRPLPVQYARWVGKALRGDLGRSWFRGLEVSDAIRQRVPKTLALAMTAAGIAVLLGVPVGVLAASHRDQWPDHLARGGALAAASLPSYFMAYVLILVFAVWLKALPAFGAGSTAHVVLPAVTLALHPAAVVSRLTRSAVLDVLGEEYLRTAQAKGVRPSVVMWHHALRNALIPVLTVVGLAFGHLLGGSLIVEWVFAWPGMGDLAIGAIHDRDYPLIQGFVLFAGAAYVLVNFAIDLGYAWLDPRIVLGARRPRA
ncbi:MAG: ABC transporter permease, partial [Acidimicrobiales bacterium]